MNRIIIRGTCAALAVAATVSVLGGIATLAEIQHAGPTAFAVLPKIEVIGPAPKAASVDLASDRAETNPL